MTLEEKIDILLVYIDIEKEWMQRNIDTLNETNELMSKCGHPTNTIEDVMKDHYQTLGIVVTSLINDLKLKGGENCEDMKKAFNHRCRLRVLLLDHEDKRDQELAGVDDQSRIDEIWNKYYKLCAETIKEQLDM